MILHLLENRSARGYAVFGSCWRRGECAGGAFTLTDAAGASVPVQTEIAARWPDGSVKWARHTADAEKMGRAVRVTPGGDAPAGVLRVELAENGAEYRVNTGRMRFIVPLRGGELLKDLTGEGAPIRRAYPVLGIERVSADEAGETRARKYWPFRAERVTLEENGPVTAVFRFDGAHTDADGASFRVRIRMRVYANSPEIRFAHTFFFTGDENRDFLCALGLRFEAELAGKPYMRHIRFSTDAGAFHECATVLIGNRPRLPEGCQAAQARGDALPRADMALIDKVAADLPLWNRYRLTQDSANHYAIQKRTRPGCCYLNCASGARAPGCMALGGEGGGLSLGIEDFWQKYPSGLEADGLGEALTSAVAWFYTPSAQAYDFRHYDTRSYPATCYEGSDFVGADPYGIAVTSRALLRLERALPDEESLRLFELETQKPPRYAGEPAYYHSLRAFGYWSLPDTSTETGRWLEKQLARAADFYLREVENRSWYGLFDYGDVMHAYDPVRHAWRYDVGGFAWQNTELVPTYWLWLYFLRTGREDIYALAEAMNRHAADVDMYHLGALKGLGSRHNVRHWGCACKEPRVGMAGHHRPLYYLSGDLRAGDAMDDAKDTEKAMFAYNKKHWQTDERLLVRSGPDWSSLVSNWMCAYERTLNGRFREKIENGIAGIREAPFGLASGPTFACDMETGRLTYIGEDVTTPNMHLQVCMGGPQIWLETADMLPSQTLKELLAELGRFFYLSHEEKVMETGGKIDRRPFSNGLFPSGVAAYSAFARADEALAAKVWRDLFAGLMGKGDLQGFAPVPYARRRDGEALCEIPWISTNFSAQWCLNVIMVPEFIGKWMPQTLFAAAELARTSPRDICHRA